MSKQLINHFLRIEQIKDTLEERILALAKTQLSIEQEVHQEILGFNTPTIRYDYLKVQEFTGKIERWWSRRGEPDDRVSNDIAFEIHGDILSGREDNYRLLMNDRFTRKKKNLDESERTIMIARRQALESELGRIKRELGD